jgi:hypothetical protein
MEFHHIGQLKDETKKRQDCPTSVEESTWEYDGGNLQTFAKCVLVNGHMSCGFFPALWYRAAKSLRSLAVRRGNDHTNSLRSQTDDCNK